MAARVSATTSAVDPDRARRQGALQPGLRHGQPRARRAQHAANQVPPRLDHQAVHRHGHLDPPGARQADVHDKVKKYLPDAPKAWDEITIQHLLTHTSGIFNYTESLEFLNAPVRGHAQGADRQVQGQAAQLQARRKIQVQQLGLHRARPDHRDRLGPTYPSFMKEAIFDPLKMNDTGYDNATPILKNRAIGLRPPAGNRAYQLRLYRHVDPSCRGGPLLHCP